MADNLRCSLANLIASGDATCSEGYVPVAVRTMAEGRFWRFSDIRRIGRQGLKRICRRICRGGSDLEVRLTPALTAIRRLDERVQVADD